MNELPVQAKHHSRISYNGRTQKSASVHTKALSVAPLAWIQEELNQTEGFLDQTSPRFTPVISCNGCNFVQANELLKHLWISDTP
jgi:hypothetical protein